MLAINGCEEIDSLKKCPFKKTNQFLKKCQYQSVSFLPPNDFSREKTEEVVMEDFLSMKKIEK